jgi:hypothetical protein
LAESIQPPAGAGGFLQRGKPCKIRRFVFIHHISMFVKKYFFVRLNSGTSYQFFPFRKGGNKNIESFYIPLFFKEGLGEI